MRKFNVIMSDDFRTWGEEVVANTVTEAVDSVESKYSNDEIYVVDVEESGESCWLEFQCEVAINH